MLMLKLLHGKYAQVVIILLTSISSAFGQNSSSQFDKGTPPHHAAGLSSFGSYTSADLGTINLSNGALNIRLPLASVGGRGFSVPLTLNYSSKVWSGSRHSNFADETGNHPVAFAEYADMEKLMDIYSRIGPGWTIGAAPTLILRGNGIKDNSTTTCPGDFRFALTKLSVMLPDKGEIQLRDDATNGAPLSAQLDPGINCMVRDGNRGQRWHASDGSGIVFISDTPNGIVRGDLNGVLILADGTRHRFVGLYLPPPGSPPLNLMTVTKLLARGTSITDRNGNLISITYPSANEVRYTDQLGRITKIQKNVPDPDNPSINLASLVTIPGYQGQNRYFKTKSAVMNQRYRPGINPTLPVINGDYDPLNWGLSWGTATRLFPFSHGSEAERIDVMTVPSEFVLPDGRSVEFFYNEFGEVAEVRLPTGGKLQYDYQYVSTLPAGKSHIGEVKTLHFDSDVSDVDRAVVARRTYADGATLEGTWSYSYTNATAQVTATTASGGVLLNQKHYFLASGRYLNTPSGTGPIPDRGVEGTGYALWSTGVETRSETLNAAGSAVIAAGEQDWTQRASVTWAAHTTYAQEQPENDNRVNQQRRYLDNGMMAKVETTYDQYNNPTEVKEYDFDQTLKRRTTTSYLSTNLGFNYQTDDSIHLISLPETVIVYDGSSNQVAKTITEYDVYSADGNHASLTDYAVVSQHDSTYGITKITRGNPTRVGSWLNTTGGFIYAYPRYDKLGNVVSNKDPRGNVTTISFADDFGLGDNPGSLTQNPATPTYALPTLITSPPPLPGAPVHTARSQYDFSTGLLTGFRDRNNVVTQTIYNDPFDRPTLVKSALNVSGVESHTKTFYAPTTVFGITLTKNDVLSATDQTTLDDSNIRSWTVTDGFGRTTEAWERDPQGDVKVITVYDCLNRNKQTSNPFRPSVGETPIYTTTSYDLAGRVTTVTTPDNATVTTTYLGNTVTVADQMLKKRKSVTDALGRLKEIYEDPDSANYLLTTYEYDPLDNLTKVIQDNNPQQPQQPPRVFQYDSLRRLTSATNPESGTASYQYDQSGNLIVKTDARTVSTHFAYDALNRVTRRWYNGANSLSATVHNSPALPTGVGTSDEANFYYDSQSLPSGATSFLRGSSIGRLVASTYGTGSSAGDYFGYDAAGRTLLKIQQTGTVNYQVTGEYNLAGGITSLTYPAGQVISGHKVSYAYDAAGRVGSFTGTLGDGTNRNYSTEILYSPQGGLAKEKFGTTTPIYNKLFYNSRGQLAEIRAGTTYNNPTDTGWERGAIINHYGTVNCWGASCNDPNNNGNLRQQDHWIPNDSGGVQALYAQNYDYDSLNRLKRVQEGTNWQQEYVYDRWGNRTVHQTNTYGTGIPKPNFGVDTSTNRLTAPAGYSMSYDSAGNLTNDTYTGAGTREYDAENRMTKAWGGNNQWQYYNYDADGHRTRRKIDGQETWQIYGLDGELLAEYAANGAASSPQKEYGYRNGQLLVTAAAASSGAPTSGLKGYWKFDENTGTTASDSSGYGNSGTLALGASWNTGYSGAATSLDGADDYVQVGAQTSLLMTSAASFSAWIYPTGAGSGGAGEGIIVNREGEYEIARFGDGTIRWAFANTNPGWNWINTGYVAALNQWTHVTVTYDSGVVKTYINGTLTHSYSGSGSIGDATPSQNDFRIGGRQGGSQNFRGRTDEVRVYNRALSAAEVTTLVGAPTTGLIGHWKFDENMGTTAADSSGTGNTGTLTSGAAWGTGQTGAATSLDGNNDYVQVGAQSSLAMTSSASFSAWIYPTGAGSNPTYGGTIINKEGEYVVNRYPNGRIQWGFANGNPGWNFIDTGYVAPLNLWTHLAVTYDNGTIKTYANGSLVHTFNGSGAIGDAIPSMNDFRIGGRQGDSQHFQGRIDEVRVYNRALSASEVGTLPNAAPSAGPDLNWLVTDQLGTPRMILDQSGSLAGVKRHDYLPFGEELYAGVGDRTAAQGYAAGDGVRQKFTQQERDNETALDYFLARYYSNLQGRFTSADSFAGSPLNPQTLNLYSYVQNDPLNFTDPSGHFADPVSSNPARCALFGGMGCNGEAMFQGQTGQKDPQVITKPFVPPTDPTYNPSGNILDGPITTTFDKNDPITTNDPVLATLPPSNVDYLPVGGTARKFLFNYTTHNFEGALGNFLMLAAELSPVGFLARSGRMISVGLDLAPQTAEATATSVVPAANRALGSIGNIITGFTKHGINSAISHDGVGVSTRAILNAVKNPIKVIQQSRGRVKVVGRDAIVILNRAGKVITTWARTKSGTRVK